MKETIYDFINDIDNEVEQYAICGVSGEEVQRWKEAFAKRKGKIVKKQHYGRYVAVAALLVMLLGAVPFRSQVNACVEIVTYRIQELLSLDADVAAYETVVGQTLTKDGYTLTFNEAILDEGILTISYTMTSPKKIKDYSGSKCDCHIDLYVDGKNISSGMTGESEKVDDYNVVTLRSIRLEDVNIEEEHDYKLVFYRMENADTRIMQLNPKMGSVKFTADAQNLMKDTVNIPLDISCELPNGDHIQFTKIRSNPMELRIFAESAAFGQNSIDLIGEDNLGNEVSFYCTHVSGEQGEFVLTPDTTIAEEATSVTLQIKITQYPDESGEITDTGETAEESVTIPLSMQ